MQLPVTPSFSLQGKAALVTGASSGIGLASAAALAQAGAKVTVAARRKEKLQQLVKTIQQQGGLAELLVLDVMNIRATEAAIAEAGPFDILVNSVGGARHQPALQTSEEDFSWVMDVNVKSAYFITRSVANGLISVGKPGSLINISSQMGHVGGIDRSVYCASKFAVEGFTKAMAIEWGAQKIRVNTICPTFVRTGLTTATFADPESLAWLEAKIKLARVGEVEDLMGAVVYLASEAADLVTGSSLLVDGGWTAD